jgi:hypothetical protein
MRNYVFIYTRMYSILLQILQDETNIKHKLIKYENPTKDRCGKLWIHTYIQMLINTLVKSSPDIMIELCEYYNMKNGDIVIQYEGYHSIVSFMYLKGEKLVQKPDYSIHPSIAIFTNSSISYNEEFPLGYWDL